MGYVKIHFFAGHGPRVHELKKQLGNCTQQGVAVLDYFWKLPTIWDELANYKKDPDYCCG